MSPAFVRSCARALVALHPRAWRERYAEEVLQLVDDIGGGRQLTDLARGLAAAWAPEGWRRARSFALWYTFGPLFIQTLPWIDNERVGWEPFPSGFLPSLAIGMALAGLVYWLTSLPGVALLASRHPTPRWWKTTAVKMLPFFATTFVVVYARRHHVNVLLPALTALDGSGSTLIVMAAMSWAQPTWFRQFEGSSAFDWKFRT